MELIEQLKKDGIDKGLCEAWQKKLKANASIKRLIDLYVRGIDFCIQKDYPTLNFIRDNFKGKCEMYGVYIDEHIDLYNVEDIVLNGNCNGTLSYCGYSVCRAYIRHNSIVDVDIYGFAHLTVDIFDQADLSVNTHSKNARVIINVYGDAKVKIHGNGAKVIYKNQKTY